MRAVSPFAPSMALIFLLAVPVGCGGSDPGSDSAGPTRSPSADSTVDADFIARANTTCDPYREYTTKTFLRLPGFNRYAPDPAFLPRVAAHLAQNPAYKDLLSDLEALGDPQSGAAAWATVLDDFRTTARDVEDEIAGARDADAAHFPDLVAQLEQDTTQLHTDLGTAGMADSSCVAAEGDALKPPPREGG